MRKNATIIVIICLLVLLCSCGQIADDKSDAIEKNTVEVTEESEVLDENKILQDAFQVLIDAGADKAVMDKSIKNILLIGNDRRPGQKEEMRSDAMLIASINLRENKVKFFSLMRDMYIMCADGMNSPLNLTYYRGGMDLLDETIEKSFGIHIDGNLEVDFYRFIDVMNVLGPIDIELNAEEAEWLNGSSTKGAKWYWWNDEVEIKPEVPWTLHAGINSMTAEQVEDYCRLRKVGRSDFERVLRQQRVMQTIYEKLQTYDMPSLIQFFNAVIPYIHSDLSTSEILGYVYTLWSHQIDSFENYRIPLDDTITNQIIEDENYGKLQIMIPDLEVNKATAIKYIYGSADYDDVLYTDEYANAVFNVTEKGYMGATGERIFSPKNGITRGSIAQILYKMADSPETKKIVAFSDVDRNKWYYNGICWATQNNIITGYENNSFLPDAYITNQQLYAVLFKYAKFKGYDTSVNKKISDVKDVNNVSDYALDAVKWAKGHKLISSQFAKPKNVTTREELAGIITEFEKYVIKK